MQNGRILVLFMATFKLLTAFEINVDSIKIFK